ncbi:MULTISPECIES: 3-keto-5-aminohexanoate cleavage protein [unclassified Streptomyces]|uniref:3-keto-5-aminohexanoate cleavage protein n=1 Tax=unclassified Streptomyces TaxID=2593676 RepID=UPI003664A4A5
MLLKAAVNGGRSQAEQPTVPVTAAEIAADTVAVLAAGADVVHFHVRTPDGGQTIRPDALAEVLSAIRGAAPDAVVGTTTGLWTCSGPVERYDLVKAWEVLPDFASVAFSEEGAAETARLVLDRGMVLESAVWTRDDVPRLLDSPTLHDNVRILIEPVEEDPVRAVAEARAMAAQVRAAGVRCPILYHGDGPTVWPLVRAAIEDGHETRVGFEDGTDLPDGSPAPDNAALVRAARALAAS